MRQAPRSSSFFVSALCATALLASACSSSSTTDAAVATDAAVTSDAGGTLYARLGNRAGIAAAVDAIVVRELADPEIASYFYFQVTPGRSGMPPVDGHPNVAQLKSCLVNQLANAIKYNRPRGQVVIEAEPGERFVCLRVRDTGRGLNPEQLSHLFEPFNRLGLDHEGIEGSGIGLTVVKALVESMGGQVHASSLVGHGTVFEFTLPASAGVAAPEPLQVDPSPAATRPQRSGTLLYIEDNSVNVLLVEELVKTLPGLRIVCEGTGAAGVARALSLRPDVILVDLQLPDFDGFEVLRQLRARPETAATPCIALSANAMPEDIARGLASGFDDYWTKPIKFKPFIDALERLFPGAAPAMPLKVPEAPGPAA